MSDETKDADNPDEVHPTQEKDLISFKNSLRKACEDEAEGKPASFSNFFAYGPGRNVPPEYDGSHDRTFGFHRMTTVLKTFGEQEGVRLLLKMYPYYPDLETGVLAVFNKSLKEIDRAAAARFAKARLVTACTETSAAIKEVLAYESDHVLQHSLTSLQGELAWCARELNPEGRHDA